MLNSCVGIVASGSGIPPFIHTTHEAICVFALSTCLKLLRTCHKSQPGSESSIVDTIQEEMKKLCSQHSDYNDTELLVAFQAHLIYCILLFFHFASLSHAFRRQAMTDLQTLACASSHGGLVCVAERTGARPPCTPCIFLIACSLPKRVPRHCWVQSWKVCPLQQGVSFGLRRRGRNGTLRTLSLTEAERRRYALRRYGHSQKEWIVLGEMLDSRGCSGGFKRGMSSGRCCML
jgi:hypothetical protein